MTSNRFAVAAARRAWLRWVGLAIAVLCAACARDRSSDGTVATIGEAVTVVPIALSVSPPAASVPATVQQPFKATLLFSNGRKKRLTSGAVWSVSDPTVASVDANGLVTALAPGSVTVTAAAQGVNGTAALTVTRATLVSVALTPVNRKIQVSTSVMYTAMGTFSDGSKHKLTGAVFWTSSDATVASVDTTGRATGLAAGTVSITATHVATGLAGKTFLTVGTAALASVAVTPAASSAPVGLDVPFVATGSYTDGTTMDLTDAATWSSSNGAVAIVSNLADSPGVATAVSAGASTITAVVAGKRGKATFTVTPAVLRSIAVSPQSKSVPNGTTLQLVATGTYSDNTTQDLTAAATWSSSSPAVFVSDALGSDGLASALALGTATVTATDSATGISGGASLTVTPALLTSLAITPPSSSVALGVAQQFTATGTFTDATTRDVTARVTWSSDAPAIASVSNDPAGSGAATSLSLGTANVTALDPSTGVTATATLKVTPAVLTALAIDPAGATIANGLAQAFTASGTYSDGSHRDLTSAVTWSVPSGTATVSNAPSTVGVVTSNGVGQSTVHVLDPTTGVSATVLLTVTAATLVSINVTPALPSIALGTNQPFLATGTYSDNTTQDLTASVTWSTSNAVATVSNVPGSIGLATGTGVGTTTVTATSAASGVSGATTLTVTAAVLASIAITPPVASVPLGTAQQFRATGIFTDSSTQDLTASVTWASSAPNVLSVSSSAGSAGLGAALAIGVVTLSATDPTMGVTGSTPVTVSPAVLVSIEVALQTISSSGKASKKESGKGVMPSKNGGTSLPLGDTLQLFAIGTYSDGSAADISVSVTWSAAGAAATVSNAAANPGLVTTVSVGPATITAADPATGVSGSMSIDVTAALLVSMVVTPSAQAVPSGLTQQFTAIGTYTDGTTQDLTTSVTWASSTPSATISNAAGSAGLATAAVVGVAGIIATDPVTGVFGVANLTTTAAVLESIAVGPSPLSLPLGTSEPLTAIGSYSDGSTLDLTTIATWSSTTANASVSNATGSAGVVTGVALGPATLLATEPTSHVVGSASVAVVPVPLRTVTGTLADVWWEDDGTQVTAPMALPAGTNVWAIPMGQSTRLPGTLDLATGNISIPNVPEGKYWLMLNERASNGPVLLEEHESSTPNLTNLWVGRPDVAEPTQTTNVTFNVTGLTPWQAGVDLLELTASNAGLWATPFGVPFSGADLSAGATSVNQSLDWLTQVGVSLPDATKGDALYVHQLSSTAVTSGAGAGTTYERAVAYAQTSNVTITDGSPATIPAALVAAPQTGSVAANLHAADFEALSSWMNPAATPLGLTFYVDASAHATSPAPRSLWGTPDMLYLVLAPHTANVDLGTLTYGQFLGPLWHEFVWAGYQWSVPVTALGATTPQPLQVGTSSAYPAGQVPTAYAPVLGPPTTLTIVGLDAYQEQANVGLMPVLTFGAPSLGSPTSYAIKWFQATVTPAGRTRLTPIATQLLFPDSGQTTASVALPSGVLMAGSQYLALITAIESSDRIDQGGLSITQGLIPTDYPLHQSSTATALFSP